MNKLLLLTLTCTTSCTRSLTDIDYYDTCPSDAGYSCPEDGSPCPFCVQ